MSEKRIYGCPACGKPTTTVVQTLSLSSCIIRKRQCLTCGYLHETTEIPIELSKAMQEAVFLLAENAAARARKNCL